ncbi:D-2-hydroxyacid dehydrogenase [Pelagibius sp. Alg239-R121]|uniref:D-2-hydroxyacid dehydrogenase n=1 Tax=Pelagibius sp. Alg239-R121 TaxID=2993448 RepID=UPI0024A6F006|nr:D-2-hydroxyacid dehydrogenase [Pelagibius sp. Alg239-R121]
MNRKIKLHVKNNHASPDTFPSTAEGELVFTTTQERWDDAARRHPDVAQHLDVFIDWDCDHFNESMRDTEVLFCWDLPTADLAAVAPNLKWIHILGAGVEHLCPMNWVPDGVQVVNNKGAHSVKAGEFGLMSVLMLHSHIPAIVTNQQSAHWKSLFSSPIAGKTALIVGVGSLGGGAAKQLKTLGLEVLGVNRSGNPHPAVDEMVATDQIDRLLPRADYVFISLPATPETVGLFNRKRLESMKPGAGIINVGRASAMDYDALSDLLRSGHLSGAIVDVFDPEPLPADSPLWSVPNLIVTPHVSADDGDNYVPITLDILFNNLRRYINGQPLENVVRPELGY